MLTEIDTFVNWLRRRNPAARTWRDYRGDLTQFAAVAGDRPPIEVTFRDVDRFVAAQVARGFQPATVNRRLAAITSFYTFLADEDPKLVCPVFPHRHQPLSVTYCCEGLRTYGQRCGVMVKPHQLRHSCATLLLNAGAPVLTVQTILGHKFVDTTLGYARLYDGTVAADYYQALVLNARHGRGREPLQ
jgi:site-specific recombinase XerD